MGVYIKGMEMPTCCYKCPMRRRDGMDLVCPIAHERFSVADVNILEYRLDNCPLGPVPPHGRLIDADSLVNELVHSEFFSMSDYNNFVGLTLKAPTIIPAEEKRKEEGEAK